MLHTLCMSIVYGIKGSNLKLVFSNTKKRFWFRIEMVAKKERSPESSKNTQPW